MILACEIRHQDLSGKKEHNFLGEEHSKAISIIQAEMVKALSISWTRDTINNTAKFCLHIHIFPQVLLGIQGYDAYGQMHYEKT